MHVSIPEERPLQFKQIVFNNESHWMIERKLKTAIGAIDEFRRVSISRLIYNQAQLQELFKIAKQQKEPADLMSWIQNELKK